MKKLILLLSLLGLQTLSLAQVKMTDSEIKNFQNKVTSDAKTLQSLSADFTQTKHISFLSKPITSTGKLYLKADEKLKWEYVTPTKYTVVFKNKTLLVNNQGKQQKVDLASNKQFEKLSKLISGTINGNLFDDKEFVVSYFKLEDQNLVKLKPKNKDLMKYVKEIELYFDKSGKLVDKTKMIEPNDDYTLIIFSKKKLNQTIHDSVFSI